MKINTIILSAAAMLLTASCLSDNYSTGTGSFSIYQGDIVDSHTDANCKLDYIRNDSDMVMYTKELYSIHFMTRPDTTYRTLAVYAKTTDGKADIAQISLVPTITPSRLRENEEMRTHPVTLNSIWRGKNGKYLNINIGLMVGTVNGTDQSQHVIGMIDNGVDTLDSGKTTTRIELYHDQGGVREFYTSNYIMSVPCQPFTTDSIHVKMNTYKGIVEKSFAVRQGLTGM